MHGDPTTRFDPHGARLAADLQTIEVMTGEDAVMTLGDPPDFLVQILGHAEE